MGLGENGSTPEGELDIESALLDFATYCRGQYFIYLNFLVEAGVENSVAFE